MRRSRVRSPSAPPPFAPAGASGGRPPKKRIPKIHGWRQRPLRPSLPTARNWQPEDPGSAGGVSSHWPWVSRLVLSGGKSDGPDLGCNRTFCAESNEANGVVIGILTIDTDRSSASAVSWFVCQTTTRSQCSGRAELLNTGSSSDEPGFREAVVAWLREYHRSLATL